MDEVLELKEWLRIDSNEEDGTLSALLSASKMIIKQATGITEDDVENNQDAHALYKLAQKILITDIYENRDGSKSSSGLTPIYIQLEAYKLELEYAEKAESGA